MPTWTPAIAVGHPVIDRQHQELFERADRLLEAMRERRAPAEVEGLLAFLEGYVLRHFADEEWLMEVGSYSRRAAHRAEHAAFEREIGAVRRAFGERGPSPVLVLEVKDLLRNWLVRHVSTVDAEMAHSLEAQGGDPPPDAQNSARSMRRPPR